MTQKNIAAVDAAIERSVEELASRNPDASSFVAPGASIARFMTASRSSNSVPGWWSPTRDAFLDNLWRRIDFLKLAVYNAQAKLSSIPWYIEPKDKSMPRHHDVAEELTVLLKLSSEFGETINVSFAKFYIDLLTQDNGAFLEVLGGGSPDGPIEGMPYAVRHLDAARTTRTGNPIYPVTYRELDGRLYKVHYSRVIMMSQMTSPRRDANGIGLCAVSRCIEIAKGLDDVIKYKQQKLGSRPQRQIIVGKGITGAQISTALNMIDEELDNMGNTIYAGTAAIGSENPEIGLELVNLIGDDPFDEESSIQIGMFAMSSAFGMEATELWPVSGRASTNDQRISNLRSRNKLAGQVMRALEAQINMKLMPPYLEFRFDFRDDDEDQQRAIISDIRARKRDRDMKYDVLDVRGARYDMLSNGEVNRATFEELELASGRLEDGTPIESLFFNRRHEDYVMFLNLGTPNPLVVSENDADEMISKIQVALQNVYTRLGDTSGREKRKRMMQCVIALKLLEKLYTEEKDKVAKIEAEEAKVEATMMSAESQGDMMNQENQANPDKPEERNSSRESTISRVR